MGCSTSKLGSYFKGCMLFVAVCVLSVLVAGCSDGGGDSGDRSAPTVSSTGAPDGATGQPTNGTSTVIFDSPMDPASINSTTFTVTGPGATPVPGSVSYSGNTATFTPTSALAANTTYTATITTGAKNLAGNALASPFVATFTTGATADTTVPVVSSTIPQNAAIGVTIDGNIAATFSEAMNPLTVTAATMTLKQGSTPVAGTVTYVGATVVFNPASNLAANTIYTASITTGVKDLVGNPLAVAKTWSFTTGTTADIIAPTVTSTLPVDMATGIAVNANITATFNEAMNPLTVTSTTITLKQGSTAVAGVVTSPSTTTATFNPANDLTPGKVYTAEITTGVKDLAGNPLAVSKTWSFTTLAAVAKGPAPVDLGLAGNYVILAKTAVSTTGTTAIVGNIGVSPAAQTYITGFSEARDATNEFAMAPIVTGKIYAADMASPTPSNLTTAIGNMETAYTDAAGRPTPDFNELYTGNISGKTLEPGLYKWSNGVSINSDVTLNGGPNDVWIFQIAGDITQANGTKIILAGGALPKNIFWQVAGGTGVAIGTTAHFEGVILAIKAITLNTGASVNGRLLAQTAVTLEATAITAP